MTLTPIRLLVGATLALSIAVLVACSGASPSMSPTAPTASATSASASANFSPNPLTCEEDPTQPECQPPPPSGTPCSPGYWKTHETAFATYCGAAAALSTTDPFGSCGSLLTALTCRGSDASCGRSAAAALLDTVSGCVESD